MNTRKDLVFVELLLNLPATLLTLNFRNFDLLFICCETIEIDMNLFQFTSVAKASIEKAERSANLAGKSHRLKDYLFIALLEEPESTSRLIFHELNLPISIIKEKVLNSITSASYLFEDGDNSQLGKVIFESYLTSKIFKAQFIRTEHILISVLRDFECLPSKIMCGYNVDHQKIEYLVETGFELPLTALCNQSHLSIYNELNITITGTIISFNHRKSKKGNLIGEIILKDGKHNHKFNYFGNGYLKVKDLVAVNDQIRLIGHIHKRGICDEFEFTTSSIEINGIYYNL